MAKLTGNEALEEALEAEQWSSAMTEEWIDELIQFNARRKAYLIYPLIRN
jgi:uncharacterized protein YbbC (DUF1343 family)